jgi:hypothetical protein
MWGGAFALTIENVVSRWDFLHRSRHSIHDIGDHQRIMLLSNSRTSLFLIAEDRGALSRQSIQRQKLPSHTGKFTRSAAYRLGRDDDIHRSLTHPPECIISGVLHDDELAQPRGKHWTGYTSAATKGRSGNSSNNLKDGRSFFHSKVALAPA